MKRNTYSLMSKMMVATALAAGAAGVANADDGSMGRFGDSYAYFNSQLLDKAPSAWRADNPNGISERQLQAYSGSTVSLAWETTKPVFDRAPSDFGLAYPNGLSEREFQALSSEGPAWHTQAAPRAVASSGQTDVVQAAK
ncbi:MAG TPA: hypothetical protein VGI10_24275 [Polyangiaceae bacterium]